MTIEVVINVYVVSEKMDYVVDKLKLLPEVVDLYEVTGESDIITLVRTEDIGEFRDFLKNKLMKIEGVRSTVTSVVLHKHKREGVIIEV
ncbi:MAG: Lrp/AsnC ligand binding domain-containing protein [Candidatus Odinarchaeum yellowstonii]|uniref:Lrp/AsnC ligand binding domain-containing protein n=1 Tax=Odinarchaeota yellowstonii (strain LCB_4) TaxID=1841599 RepID=A0AAF0IAL1_ODILC|nr:MAG: Lrp/AsnC ligand binding domain-containing protein [Candidatus Odinarchaeum yellowstonii]